MFFNPLKNVSYFPSGKKSLNDTIIRGLEKFNQNKYEEEVESKDNIQYVQKRYELNDYILMFLFIICILMVMIYFKLSSLVSKFKMHNKLLIQMMKNN
jgi:hypothetical protein